MKLIEVKKTAIETTAEDWKKLGELSKDFLKICISYSDSDLGCGTAFPFHPFCMKHESPTEYFDALMDYLDD